MIDYSIDVGNTNGVLGDFTAKNASGATATDGTPYLASFIDDIWGPKQALMARAGLVPNGVTESVAASQILEAMIKGFALGAGYIQHYMKVGSPAVNGDRVLLLTGQGVLTASFPELTLATYVGDANNPTASAFYKATDAAGTIRSTTGIFLILFDARGLVMRGLDVGAINDPDGAGRDLGNFQEDQFQGHQHQGPITINNAGPGSSRNTSGGGNTEVTVLPYATDGINGTPRVGLETRMKNFTTNIGISY